MWRNKAKVLAMKKEFEEALTCYDTATEINPHDYETLVERALLLEMFGRNKEAIAGLEEAAEVDVKSTRALQILGNIHLKMGQFKKGITYYDRILERDAENIESYNARAWRYLAYANIGRSSVPRTISTLKPSRLRILEL